MRKMLPVLFLLLLLTACGDRAKDLYETAQFEERQFNKTHAAQLYREIVDRYPDSPYASSARQRLAEIEQPAGE